MLLVCMYKLKDIVHATRNLMWDKVCRRDRLYNNNGFISCKYPLVLHDCLVI